MKTTVLSLLVQSLKDSLLFQHNPDELRLWLNCLLHTMQHPTSAQSVNSVPESDRRKSLLVFLDDCMQRCAKTPYKYLEEMHSLQGSEIASKSIREPTLDSSDTVHTLEMSPLVMTVIEQLAAKSRGSLLSASDLITIVSYIRNVVVSLLGNQNDMNLCRAIIRKLEIILTERESMDGRPSVSAALAKELAIISTCVNSCSPDDSHMQGDDSPLGTITYDEIMVPDRYLLQQSEKDNDLVASSIEEHFQKEDIQLGEFKRLAGLILHRSRKMLTYPLLKYLVTISLSARRKLDAQDLLSFKRFIFLDGKSGLNIWTARCADENIVEGSIT